jgi:diketogulonate reductase-like aldo/keto reductase
MRRRSFGPTGAQVPVVGQGTWNMERDDRKAAIAALRHGLDLGLTHVDTAELYGDGKVEEMVGEAIAGRREEVFLVSKVLPQNASRRGTVAACERSLRRLRTDRLDVYLLHWPGDHPLAGTIAAFEALAAAGKIGAWGLSNFDTGDLDAALALGVAGEGRIACDQVFYHLAERAVEHRVLPFCARRRIAVVAYSPLGSGRFPSPSSRGGRVLAEIAGRRGVSPRAVALAFLLRSESVFVIPKAARPEHVEDNAAAGALDLDPDEIRRIDEAFPRGKPKVELPTL